MSFPPSHPEDPSVLNGPAKVRKSVGSLPNRELMSQIGDRVQAQPVLAAPVSTMPQVAKTATGPNVPAVYPRIRFEILENQMADLCGFWWRLHANKVGPMARYGARLRILSAAVGAETALMKLLPLRACCEACCGRNDPSRCMSQLIWCRRASD